MRRKIDLGDKGIFSYKTEDIIMISDRVAKAKGNWKCIKDGFQLKAKAIGIFFCEAEVNEEMLRRKGFDKRWKIEDILLDKISKRSIKSQ